MNFHSDGEPLPEGYGPSDGEEDDGEPLQEGYGPSFDYRRDRYDVPAVFKGFPPLYFIHLFDKSKEILDWVRATYVGLLKGEFPIKLAEKGAGGTYFCYDETRKLVAVFKPYDEEAKARNNPKSDYHTYSSNGLIEGTKVGKGAAREVAAYLLDHPTKSKRREGFTNELMGFGGVPPTIPICCLHEDLKYHDKIEVSSTEVLGHYKFGSLQMFMTNDGNCDSKGINLTDVPVEEVHKICLLDIRFSNADRHLGNLLFSKGTDGKIMKLIPIDHGYCFPENFKRRRLDWLDWEQSQKNFNQEFIDYIDSLDSKKDIDLLIRNNFIMSYKFARTLHISTMLLQKGVKKGLTPYEIGNIMCVGVPVGTSDNVKNVYEALKKLVDEDLGEKSVLEKIVSEAINKVVGEKLGAEPVTEQIIRKAEEESELKGMTKAAFEEQLLETVSEIMESKLNEYSKELKDLREEEN